MPLAMRAIDRLKSAANLVPTKRSVLLNNGEEFTFYCRPLTMAEREKAQREAKTDDAGQFALQLLVNKAMDENGQRLFMPADIVELKHAVRDEDLQALMLAILKTDEEDQEEQPVDMKRTRKAAEE
jgi:hypothetical protein